MKEISTIRTRCGHDGSSREGICPDRSHDTADALAVFIPMIAKKPLVNPEDAGLMRLASL
jgi:hypothetical protein